jgi:hypothetical protein
MCRDPVGDARTIGVSGCGVSSSSLRASGTSLPECPKRFYLVDPLTSDGIECLEKPVEVGDLGGVYIELSNLY